MRQKMTFPVLLVGIALSLSACVQPASVGIPTPDQVALAAQAAALTAVAAVPEPTMAPVELPTNTPEPLPPDATETPVQVTVATRAPAPQAQPQPQPRPNTTNTCNRTITHIVRPGENLFRIALRYKTTIYAIARRNGITNVRLIRSGQRLSIVTCAR